MAGVVAVIGVSNPTVEGQSRGRCAIESVVTATGHLPVVQHDRGNGILLHYLTVKIHVNGPHAFPQAVKYK